MDIFFTIIILLGVLLIALLTIWIIKKELKEMREKEPFQYIKQDIEAMRSESTRLIRETTEELTRVSEGQKQVLDVTEQLKNLQDMLRNPKHRGIVGEFILETLLRNTIPPGSYQMQYSFPNGKIVDAAIFVKEEVIPVDSKFSLENYNKINSTKNSLEVAQLEKLFVSDLKKRIVETAEYIRPEEGTTDFAFMFIPHEAIYYDLLINKIGDSENLVQIAASKYRVIIVSPTSFLAYLQTVLQGLKAMKIEESTKELKKKIERLQRHFSSYESFMESLGKSMDASANHYNRAMREFKKIDKDFIMGESDDKKANLYD